MATATESEHLGRPPGRTGSELLGIARHEFLAKGYAGTTMDAVAGAARISKNSLYRQYASKDLLFAAVVSDWVDRGHDAMRPHTDALLAAPDSVDQLRRLAGTIQAAVLDPSARQMRTLVAAEARRFPDVAADYVMRSWGATSSSSPTPSPSWPSAARSPRRHRSSRPSSSPGSSWPHR